MKDILAELAEGRIPPSTGISENYPEELVRLIDHLSELQQFVTALSQGDLSRELSSPGTIACGLKEIQTHLRRLVRQTKQIAGGDFSQRIHFLGDFSEAFNSMVKGLEDAHKELFYLGTHDSLTGLFNRSFFHTEVKRLSKGRNFPISFILADMDIFRGTGRALGEQLRQKVALLFAEGLRADDILAGTGGDEFSVILPCTDEKVSQSILARLQSILAKQATEELPIRITFGTATAEEEPGVKGALQKALDQVYPKG